MNAVQELARLYGVADAYVDYRAQPREVSLQSQAAILAAIGVDAADEQAAAAAIHQHETVRWMRLLPPVVVVESRRAAHRAGLGAARARRHVARVAHQVRRRQAAQRRRAPRQAEGDRRRQRRGSRLSSPVAETAGSAARLSHCNDRAGHRAQRRAAPDRCACSVLRASRDHSGRAGVGHRCAALRPALAAQLGHGRFSRSARAGPSRRAARLRHRRPQSAARADAGESSAHQSVQPVEPPVSERALHQRRGRAGLRRVRRGARARHQRRLSGRAAATACNEQRRLRRRRGREVRGSEAPVRELPPQSPGPRQRACTGVSQFRRDTGRTAAAARDLRRARCASAAARTAVLGLAELAGGLSRSGVADREPLRARARAGRRVLPVSAVARSRAAAAKRKRPRASSAWRSACTATSPSAPTRPAPRRGRTVTCIARAHPSARRPMRSR